MCRRGKRCLRRSCSLAAGMRCLKATASPRSRPRSTKRAPGANNWPNRTTKTFMLPRGFCLVICAPIFTPSTPTAASPTIWVTRWAIPRRLWPCLICGVANWMPATKAARVIRYLLRWPKPFANVLFPRSRLPICWSPFARTRLSLATRPSKTCWLTAATRPILSAAWCSTLAARRLKKTSAFPTSPVPRCNWPTFGRMCARTTAGAAFTFRKMIWKYFASARSRLPKASPRPSFAG